MDSWDTGSVTDDGGGSSLDLRAELDSDLPGPLEGLVWEALAEDLEEEECLRLAEDCREREEVSIIVKLKSTSASGSSGSSMFD